MVNFDYVKAHTGEYKEMLSRRQIEPESLKLEEVLHLYDERKKLTSLVQELERKRNLLSGKVEEREEAKALKQELQGTQAKLRDTEERFSQLSPALPNLLAEDVPTGKDESENVVLREVGEKPHFTFNVQDYLSLAGNLINLEQASKAVRARFAYIMGDLALMEFALIQLALKTLLPHGFVPVVPPVMIKPDVMRAMGKFRFIVDGDAFHVSEDNLYLVGSAEHTLGPLHMGYQFKPEELPRRYVGFSTCFRREAGSYGKDTKGILRVHQFDKVELFSFSRPENSDAEHTFLLERQEELMQKLELPYRVVQICSGDIGFGDYKQFDIETWMPGQGAYRETQSCSNTTDYQARGIRAKWRNPETGKAEFVHMLNATAFAIGRMLIAILENYQQEDGSVGIPKALQEYMGKEKIETNIRNS